MPRYNPYIDAYPDLKRKVEAEIAKTRRICNSCQINKILEKYTKIAKSRKGI